MIISSHAFESGRGQLVSALRQAYGGGTFTIFGNCTPKDVVNFYKLLKDDFEYGDCSTIVQELKHLGYQENGYWVLSENVSRKSS